MLFSLPFSLSNCLKIILKVTLVITDSNVTNNMVSQNGRHDFFTDPRLHIYYKVLLHLIPYADKCQHIILVWIFFSIFRGDSTHYNGIVQHI